MLKTVKHEIIFLILLISIIIHIPTYVLAAMDLSYLPSDTTDTTLILNDDTNVAFLPEFTSILAHPIDTKFDPHSPTSAIRDYMVLYQPYVVDGNPKSGIITDNIFRLELDPNTDTMTVYHMEFSGDGTYTFTSRSNILEDFSSGGYYFIYNGQYLVTFPGMWSLIPYKAD